MIEESDNASAYSIYGVVGADGMRKVARLADGGLRPGLRLDRHARLRRRPGAVLLSTSGLRAGRIAARSCGALLLGIVPIQRWGIPAAAGPAGWKTYFKGGWLGLDNHLMLQAAWLEKGKKRWALAVMTDDNPDASYGWDTQKGVDRPAARQAADAAYLALVLE